MRDFSDFEERHLDYIVEKHVKSNHVLATELNHRFHTDFSDNDVALARRELKLPPPDEAASLLQSAKLSEDRIVPVHRGMKNNRPISAAQAKTEQKRSPPEVKKHFSFTAVSEQNQKRLDALLKENRRSSDFRFTPVLADVCKKGNIYVDPGHGPVQCEGVETTTAAGMILKTVLLRELYAASPAVMKVPEGQLKKRQVRELASTDIMDAALYKLRHGKSGMKKMPSVAKHKMALFDQILATSDVAAITDLLCLTMGGGKTEKTMTDYEKDVGNRCLHMLASEYAAIRKLDYREALGLFSAAVSRPTLDQLKEQPQYGRSSDPEPGTP